LVLITAATAALLVTVVAKLVILVKATGVFIIGYRVVDTVSDVIEAKANVSELEAQKQLLETVPEEDRAGLLKIFAEKDEKPPDNTLTKILVAAGVTILGAVGIKSVLK